MDTGTFHPDTRAYRVNPVIIRLNRYLGSFSRHPDDLFDRDQPIINLRHFRFKQPFQKHGGGA